MVFGRVVFMVVHTEHDREIFSLGRRRNNNFFRAGRDVLARIVGVGEMAGRFDHDVDAELFPRKQRRIFVLKHADVVPVDHDGVVQ